MRQKISKSGDTMFEIFFILIFKSFFLSEDINLEENALSQYCSTCHEHSKFIFNMKMR